MESRLLYRLIFSMTFYIDQTGPVLLWSLYASILVLLEMGLEEGYNLYFVLTCTSVKSSVQAVRALATVMYVMVSS